MVETLESGAVPPRVGATDLDQNLARVTRIIAQLLDTELFPWLAAGKVPAVTDRHRAATIVADRLCGPMSDPIIRNAQEARQLNVIGDYLRKRGYRQKPHPVTRPLSDMEPGTFTFRRNVIVGDVRKVKIPIDVVIQPRTLRPGRLPILIEAKSAGDFTNVNKRRKEEAKKMSQLKATYGTDVAFVLFLCGYFDAGYLGYEAAEGMDWIWEHRIQDMDQLGL